MTKPRVDGTDIKAWETGTVPPDVRRCLLFVFMYRQAHGVGPSWKKIADRMGWPNDRLLWRHKMKRMRRWGLRWQINQPGSTGLSGAALPHVRKAYAEAQRNILR